MQLMDVSHDLMLAPCNVPASWAVHRRSRLAGQLQAAGQLISSQHDSHGCQGWQQQGHQSATGGAAELEGAGVGEEAGAGAVPLLELPVASAAAPEKPCSECNSE